MTFRNILCLDAGYSGAMLLGRQANDGPQIVTRPYRWDWQSKARWEKHRPEVEAHFLYLLQSRPAVVAIEKPRSILHRQHVGVAQGLQVGRWQHIAETALPSARVLLVDGQGPARAAEAWAILRFSLAEIVTREEFRELNRIAKGEPGEHVADDCAILIAALEELRAERKAVG